MFLWPLLLPLRWQDPQSRAGLAIYALGVLVCFASWLPLIYSSDAAWSRSVAGLMEPAYTPLIWLAGIALTGGSRPYALTALLFVELHVYHNILAHRLLRKRQSA